MPDFRGSPGSPFTRIGEVELLSEQTFRNQFEVAAWWEDVTCQPQAVELKSNGYWVVWAFHGLVTNAHFPALFGGVAYTKYDPERDRDKQSKHVFQWYANGFARRRMTGKLDGEMLFYLDPAFGCGVRTYGYRDGEIRTSYFLTISNAEAQGCVTR